MTAALNEWAESNFPASKTDLYSMFIERSIDLCVVGGHIGIITMHSWMFLTSFEKLRFRLFHEAHLAAMAHLGVGAFDTIGGAVVATTAFILVNRPSDRRGVFVRLTDAKSEAGKAKTLARASLGLESECVFTIRTSELRRLPGSVVAYWIQPVHLKMFEVGRRLADVYEPKLGMYTGDDAQFLRYWFEVSIRKLWFNAGDISEAKASGKRWFPCNKGGSPTRWYGNQLHVIDWEDDGKRLRKFPGAGIRNPQYFFRESVSWSNVAAGQPAFRYYPEGFVFSGKGPSIFTGSHRETLDLLAYLNSSFALAIVGILSASLGIEVGHVSEIPVTEPVDDRQAVVAEELIGIMRAQWDANEESWGFTRYPIVGNEGSLQHLAQSHRAELERRGRLLEELEEENDQLVMRRFGLEGDLKQRAHLPDPIEADTAETTVRGLVSYAVGCMFGRYSLDEPGLILADQGSTLEDYLASVPTPTFMPDADNVIPIVDGDWFEDDIVARLRKFLRTAFGERHFEENLRFVTESLGVKDLRDYFVRSFYKDHVQRYKKRPIYWLFSSPKGSFNALIYMHRYTASTVSTVLNEYLREFKAKLEATLGQQERLAGGGTPRQQATAQKEADRIRKMLLELDEYEHDVLYPLASQQIEIDLDDGVKVNYPKFGAALKKIPGLEAAE